ncbi:MAG: PAS domain S-box protein [Bacteroidetes bacterium]|nr:PAS domain S-box protein [Bacteroidota bacterium]
MNPGRQAGKRILTVKFFRLNDSTAGILLLDSTDQQKSQQSILEEKIKYEEFYKNTPVMIATLDQNGIILDANAHWYVKTSYSRHQVIGKKLTDFLTFGSRQKFSSSGFNELLTTGHLSNYEVQIVKKNNELLEGIIDARALFDIHGQFLKCYVTINDVTALKELSEEYESSELKYSQLFESAIEPIVIYSSEDGIIDCNGKAEALFSKSKDELIGSSLNEFSYPNQLEKNPARHIYSRPARHIDIGEAGGEAGGLENILEKVYSGEVNAFIWKVKSGKSEGSFGNVIECEVSAGILEIKGKKIVLLFIRDRTDQLLAERKLQQSENPKDPLDKFRTIWDESDDALKLIDKSGKILLVNKKACELYEMEEKGLIQKKFTEFSLEPNKLKKSFQDFIKSKKEYSEFEYTISGSNGGEKIIEEKNLLIKLPEFKDEVILSISRDISEGSFGTDRKRTHEEIKTSELKYKKLNETKDRFLSILSHDLRAPTASIIGMVNALIEQPVTEHKELSYYLNLVYSSAKHQLNLITNLLDWSNVESGKEKFNPTQRNLRYAVREAVNSIEGLAHQKEIKIISKVDDVNVLIDGHLFERMLINLISNSIKFSYEKGKIEVTSKVKSNGSTELCVCDYGIGIPKDIQAKLFEFSEGSFGKDKISRKGTKGERGTGLGLSLCKEIVQFHGGELWIESPIRLPSRKTGCGGQVKTGNNKKSISGTKVYFTLKTAVPKIFISETLFNKQVSKTLKEELTGFKILKGKVTDELINLEKEYYSLIILDNKNDGNTEVLNKIAKKHRTLQNIWMVDELVKDSNESDVKYLSRKDFEKELGNELNKYFFELNQQKALVKPTVAG